MEDFGACKNYRLWFQENEFRNYGKSSMMRACSMYINSKICSCVCFCLTLQDLPNAMNAAEITDKLGLHSLRHRNWYIQATCATSGDGLYEGLDWLANQLKNKK